MIVGISSSDSRKSSSPVSSTSAPHANAARKMGLSFTSRSAASERRARGGVGTIPMSLDAAS